VDQPLHNYMRPGLVLCVAYPRAADDGEMLVRSVEAIASDPFFSAVEIRNVPDDGARRQMTGVLRASRLDVIYETYPRLRALGLDLNSRDGAARARAVDIVKRAIDEAAAVGAERVNIASGPDPGPGERDAAIDALVESFYDLAGYIASRDGPALALEPFPAPGQDGRLIGPTREAIELVRLVRDVYPAVGLTLDTAHMALLREDSHASLTASAPYLGQVHLSNVVPAVGDTAPPFGVPGGVYDIPQVTETLLTLFRVGFLAVGRRPPIVIRVAPRADERAEWVIAGAKRTLSEAWVRL